MKRYFNRITVVFITVLFTFSMMTPTITYAKERTTTFFSFPNVSNSQIAAEVSNDEIYNRIIAIWNYVVNEIGYYLRNDLMPAVQNSNSGMLQSDKDEIKNSMAGEAEKGIADFFNKQSGFTNEELTPQASIDNLSEAQASVNNTLWTGIYAAFTGGDILDINFDTEDFMKNNGKDFYEIFKILGYSLVLLFFSVSLIEQTIKYEIFTMRGAVNIFGRLIVSKVIIDLSSTVCLKIIVICQDVCKKLLEKSVETTLITNMPNIKVETSGIPIIGTLVDFVIAAILQLPVNFIMLTVIVSGALVMVKLLLRSFELTMLTVVSPAFFACFSSNTTNQYFKNFIVTFLQAAFQIVFMAVVYFVAIDKLTFESSDIENFAQLGAWLTKAFPNAIIILAMAVMMVKPPKVLTGLLHA